MQSLCRSTRSPTESYLQCLFTAVPDENYCALHQSYANNTDYINCNNKYLENELRIDTLSVSRTTNGVEILKNTITKLEKEPNPIYYLHELDTVIAKPTNKIYTKPTQTLPEQKIKTVSENYQTNELDLEVKLLIMINDITCADILPGLIGPVFDDVTLSEDQGDPVSMDKFWEFEDNVKISTESINKYYLFSYRDSRRKVRCFTVFTLYDMCISENFVHPITTEPISEEDVTRGKELIKLYSTKLNLFNTHGTITMGSEYKLKNKVGQLFNQFHAHSIFFDESWLISITEDDKLYTVIRETSRLVESNITHINPKLRSIQDIFKESVPKCVYQKGKGKTNYVEVETKEKQEFTHILKEYLLRYWEELFKASSKNNQYPIWIIGLALSAVNPQVKDKFPGLDSMLG